MREQISKFINFVLLASTIVFLLYPAFHDDKSITQIIRSLLEPNLTIEFMARWLVVLIFVGTLYISVLGFIYRNTPITVIATAIEIKYLDKTGRRVEISKVQHFRTNQKNVTAYVTSHNPTSEAGSVIKSEIGASMYCANKKIEQTLE